MNLPDGGRCRHRWGVGLATGLLLSVVVFACLNPRPDDQPLLRSPVGGPDDSTGTPPLDVSPGNDLSGEGAGASGGTDSANPSVPASGAGAPGADAGAPQDAGPEDEGDGDAGVLAD